MACDAKSLYSEEQNIIFIYMYILQKEKKRQNRVMANDHFIFTFLQT